MNLAVYNVLKLMTKSPIAVGKPHFPESGTVIFSHGETMAITMFRSLLSHQLIMETGRDATSIYYQPSPLALQLIAEKEKKLKKSRGALG